MAAGRNGLLPILSPQPSTISAKWATSGPGGSRRGRVPRLKLQLLAAKNACRGELSHRRSWVLAPWLLGCIRRASMGNPLRFRCLQFIASAEAAPADRNADQTPRHGPCRLGTGRHRARSKTRTVLHNRSFAWRRRPGNRSTPTDVHRVPGSVVRLLLGGMGCNHGATFPWTLPATLRAQTTKWGLRTVPSRGETRSGRRDETSDASPSRRHGDGMRHCGPAVTRHVVAGHRLPPPSPPGSDSPPVHGSPRHALGAAGAAPRWGAASIQPGPRSNGTASPRYGRASVPASCSARPAASRQRRAGGEA